MKSIRLTFLGAFLLLIASACGPGQGNAPRDIKGQKINFYTITSSDPCDQQLVGKINSYEFDNDGNYRSRFAGHSYQGGSYSYGRTGPNKASIILTYSTTADNPKSISSPNSTTSDNYSYKFDMTFESPSKGTWRTIYTNDDLVSINEYGTFEILGNSDTQS